ncbi:MAG: FmdB family zinc ribbon protein [Gemmatimonadaceae bacterium]
MVSSRCPGAPEYNLPIYEYVCLACEHRFEALVRSATSDAPQCESCGGRDIERLISTPYVKSETTKAKSMRAAKQRDQKLGHERTQEQLAYERCHND